ncbi:RNA-guided endonuclease InsQ/TnpB family protein [Scytonema sp. PCC 10023]|uniref:RNA-guided endonuclease InsQ/TnpB family protein n=1 Tax=Scytonema sp. PCC 10023 TaxID=1680591 RepID=UPI0039C71EDA
MLTSVKTKLKLSKEQRILMAKSAGIARFTYNWGLATWESLYKDGLKPNHLLLKKFFNNEVKPVLPWIKEKGVCQKVTEFAFENLGKAFKNFFEGRSKYPTFKKKGKGDSFTINAGGKPIPIGGTKIKLPTIGWVSTYEGLPHTTVKSFTISRYALDWYISCSYEIEQDITQKEIDYVGVDLGIKELAILSTGAVFANPKALKKAQNKLKRLQRQLERKKKDSHRRNRQKLRIAKAHKRVSNVRKDATHKATTYICKNHAVIGIEDLNASGMMSNRKLAGAVADSNFYEFRRQIEYKALRYGSDVVLVDRWFPSTQLCSCCGHKKPMNLSERIYSCDQCGLALDRDFNAALNLENYARKAKPCLDTDG